MSSSGMKCLAFQSAPWKLSVIRSALPGDRT